MHMAMLVISFIFGAIGASYLLYGERRGSFSFLISGLILIMFPYLIDSPFFAALIGLILIVSPFVMQRVL